MPDVKAEIEIDVQVYCGKCGAGLCRQSSGGYNEITVYPCTKCLEDSEQEGFEKGYEEGYSSGVNDMED